MTGVAKLQAWGAAAALLLLLLAAIWLVSAQDDAVPAPASVHSSTLHRVGMPVRHTQQWAQSILARPLFSISRRPPRVAQSNGAAIAAGEARLAGIIITPSQRVALFEPDGASRAVVVSVGGGINDSTIAAIDPDSVTLANGAVLHLTFDRSRPPSAPVLPQTFQQPGQMNFALPNNPPVPGGPDEQNVTPGQMPFRPIMPGRRE